MFRYRVKVSDATTLEVRNASAASLRPLLDPLWERFNHILSPNVNPNPNLPDHHGPSGATASYVDLAETVASSSRSSALSSLYAALLYRSVLDSKGRIGKGLCDNIDSEQLRERIDSCVARAAALDPGSRLLRELSAHRELFDPSNASDAKWVGWIQATSSVDERLEDVRRGIKSWWHRAGKGQKGRRLVILGSTASALLIGEWEVEAFQSIVIIEPDVDAIQSSLHSLVDRFGRHLFAKVSICFQESLDIEQRKVFYETIIVLPDAGTTLLHGLPQIETLVKNLAASGLVLVGIDAPETQGSAELAPGTVCALLDEFEMKLRRLPDQVEALCSLFLHRLFSSSKDACGNRRECNLRLTPLFDHIDFQMSQESNTFVMTGLPSSSMEDPTRDNSYGGS